uniref:HTH psq-type domain-containing protein n=1 Tax=Heterorhabditis bacteriophora TaxID=37862 RepID=A0A1I7XGG8_HETBA
MGSATKVIRFLLERERASSAGVLNDDDFNAAAKRHFIGGPNNARTIIMVYKEVEKKYIERVMSSSASFYIGNGLDAKGQFSILSNQVDMVNNNSSFLEDNNARERRLENSCGSNFFETFNTTQLLGISDKKKRNKVAVKMEPTEEEISTRKAVIREKGEIDTENNEEPWECFNGVMNPFPEKTDIDGDDIWSIICENVAPKNYTPKKKAVMRKCVALSLLRNTNRSPLFLSKLAQQYNIPRSTLVKNYNKVVAELENIKKREANKPTTCYLRKPLDKGKKIPLYPDKGGYSVLEIDIALQILFRDIQGNTLLDRPIEQMQELINHVIVEGDSLEYVANEYEIAFDHLRRICQMVINYLESNVRSVKTNQPVVVAESASRKSYSSFISVNPQVEDSVIRDSCDVHSQASSDLNNQKFIDNGNENGHHDNTNLEDVVMIENDVQIIEAEETVYSEEPMNTTTASSCSDSDGLNN